MFFSKMLKENKKTKIQNLLFFEPFFSHHMDEMPYDIGMKILQEKLASLTSIFYLVTLMPSSCDGHESMSPPIL